MKSYARLNSVTVITNFDKKTFEVLYVRSKNDENMLQMMGIFQNIDGNINIFKNLADDQMLADELASLTLHIAEEAFGIRRCC